MQPESKMLLQDMLDAANAIIGYTQGKSEDDFLQLRWLRDAVQWNFAVIGEALSALRHREPTVAERITEWPKIIGFRNQLVHGYGMIKSDVTWGIVQKKLPVLRRELEELLQA